MRFCCPLLRHRCEATCLPENKTRDRVATAQSRKKREARISSTRRSVTTRPTTKAVVALTKPSSRSRARSDTSCVPVWRNKTKRSTIASNFDEGCREKMAAVARPHQQIAFHCSHKSRLLQLQVALVFAASRSVDLCCYWTRSGSATRSARDYMSEWGCLRGTHSSQPFVLNDALTGACSGSDQPASHNRRFLLLPSKSMLELRGTRRATSAGRGLRRRRKEFRCVSRYFSVRKQNWVDVTKAPELRPLSNTGPGPQLDNAWGTTGDKRRPKWSYYLQVRFEALQRPNDVNKPQTGFFKVWPWRHFDRPQLFREYRDGCIARFWRIVAAVVQRASTVIWETVGKIWDTVFVPQNTLQTLTVWSTSTHTPKSDWKTLPQS